MNYEIQELHAETYKDLHDLKMPCLMTIDNNLGTPIHPYDRSTVQDDLLISRAITLGPKRAKG